MRCSKGTVDCEHQVFCTLSNLSAFVYTVGRLHQRPHRHVGDVLHCDTTR
jgi:hypothetical protein